MLVCTSISYTSAQSTASEVQGHSSSKAVKLLQMFSMQLQEPSKCDFEYTCSTT